MKTLLLPSGSAIPILGQGTWYMGEDPVQKQREIDALRLGMDLGITLIDTAEMYADGGAEEIVGKAILGRRSEAFLVSKVYPHNADRRGMQAACERSLRRLGSEYIDLYLLHWRGAVPLAETLEALAALKKAGKIRDFGVSNFDSSDMLEACELPGGEQIAVNQVLYNLMRRGIEWDLLPWCRRRSVPVMAYSPLESAASEQRRLLNNPQLKAVARRHEVSAAQIALAWLLRQEQIIVIPKAVDPLHVRENRAALDIVLTAQDLLELDQAFSPPLRSIPLAMR
ncbi:aldo/keto reductase [Collimonas silvisoli]|uniref:aldo/keto reductase n=1 Tax=Collimonas silvisoli TaxID=2825884 RepID=UPI001B8D3262|nr:aldo/keto reductase [Collimonas silvisoli]